MELNELRERAKLPNALHGCTSDPCGSVVCQTARDRDALLSRLEQAEQAVQRVRRLHKKLPYRVGARNTGIPEFVCEACHGEAWGAVEYPCPTIRALDGGQDV